MVVASVQVNTQMQSIASAPTSTGDINPVNMPIGGSPVMGTSIYDLFWSRLDYLLGLNPTWMTCAEASEKRKMKQTWGNDEALCNAFNVADNHP